MAMVGAVKFSFSCRGISNDASDDDVRKFFEAVGTVVSWKRVPTPGYPSCAVYVNFSHVSSVNDVLSLNKTIPEFNRGFPISVRQQAVLVAQVANALNEIKFSVSIRGVSWKLQEDQLREVLNSMAKLHSLKLASPPAWVVSDCATCRAFMAPPHLPLRSDLFRWASLPKMPTPTSLAVRWPTSSLSKGPLPPGISGAGCPYASRFARSPTAPSRQEQQHPRPSNAPSLHRALIAPIPPRTAPPALSGPVDATRDSRAAARRGRAVRRRM